MNLKKIHKKLFPGGDDKYGIYPLLRKKTNTNTARELSKENSIRNSTVDKTLKEQLQEIKGRTYRVDTEAQDKVKIKTAAVGAMR